MNLYMEKLLIHLHIIYPNILQIKRVFIASTSINILDKYTKSSMYKWNLQAEILGVTSEHTTKSSDASKNK